MNIRQKITETNQTIIFLDYYIYDYFKDKENPKYVNHIDHFEKSLDEKKQSLETLWDKSKIESITDYKELLTYEDLYVYRWFDNMNKELWDFTIDHHKPTSDVIYTFSQHLIEIYTHYKKDVDAYLNEPGNKYHSIYPLLEQDEDFKKSMKRRLAFFRKFIQSLSKFSVELKDLAKFELTEADIKLLEQQKLFEITLPKKKEAKGIWKVSTRFQLLKEKFPCFMGTLEKIPLADNRHIILSQILGIDSDNARKLINGTYPRENPEEIDKMKDFLKEI